MREVFLLCAEATKRGLGSALLRNPRKLARLVAGIAEGTQLPLTVKVRTGTSASKINVQQVVELLQGAGAAAVIVHGRTAEQRCENFLHIALCIRSSAHSSLEIVCLLCYLASSVEQDFLVGQGHTPFATLHLWTIALLHGETNTN